MKITAGLPAWLWLIVGMAVFNPAWGDDAPKRGSEDLSKLSNEELLRQLGIGNAHALPQNGRFAIVFSPVLREDAFLFDTATGRIWRQVKSSEGKGSVWAVFGPSVPEYRVWEEMERIDTSQRGEAAPGPASTSAPSSAPQFSEGDRATNPQTGARIIYRGGQWVPLQ